MGSLFSSENPQSSLPSDSDSDSEPVSYKTVQTRHRVPSITREQEEVSRPRSSSRYTPLDDAHDLHGNVRGPLLNSVIIPLFAAENRAKELGFSAVHKELYNVRCILDVFHKYMMKRRCEIGSHETFLKYVKESLDKLEAAFEQLLDLAGMRRVYTPLPTDTVTFKEDLQRVARQLEADTVYSNKNAKKLAISVVNVIKETVALRKPIFLFYAQMFTLVFWIFKINYEYQYRHDYDSLTDLDLQSIFQAASALIKKLGSEARDSLKEFGQLQTDYSKWNNPSSTQGVSPVKAKKSRDAARLRLYKSCEELIWAVCKWKYPDGVAISTTGYFTEEEYEEYAFLRISPDLVEPCDPTC